jgi:hypothetical protein
MERRYKETKKKQTLKKDRKQEIIKRQRRTHHGAGYVRYFKKGEFVVY